MTALWHRLSQTTRMFFAFGSFMVLVTLISVLFQASFFTSARLKHLAEFEIPSELEKLALNIRLQLEPSIQSSRILASDNEFISRLGDATPEERNQLVEDKLLNILEGFPARSVFMATQLADDARYYQYNLGRLQDRALSRSNPDDAWYYAFVNSGQSYELHLDTNEFSGNDLLLFVNYRNESSTAGGLPSLVAGVALEMQALTELINNYRLGNHGFVSLVTADGNIQSGHEDSILKSLQSDPVYGQLLNNSAHKVLEISHGGQDYMLSSVWMDSLKRWLIIEVPKIELTAPISKQMWAAQAIGMGLMLVALALTYPVARSLTRPLRQVQSQLGSITQSLDLSGRIQISDQAELGDLASQVNQLLQRLQQTVSEILRSSTHLNEAAIRLADTSGLGHANADHFQAGQTMAAAIEQMSSSVAEITSTMEELSASSTQIADHSQSVVDVANLTLDSSRRGADAMQELEQRMTGIHSDYAQSLQDILELGNQSKEISKVMDLINNVADQTKLIAFNAALEASSAGEAGKRFSVVAGEIRRLADSVTESTRSIEERIQAIQSSISRLVLTSEKAVNSVQSGMDVSAATASELNELVDAATRTSNAAQQISLSTKQQKTASSQVVIALRDIANASATNAQSVRSISDISEELLGMAQTLNQLMQEFHVAPADDTP